MSAEAVRTFPTPLIDLQTAHRQAQIFRLAFGMTLSAALAFGLAWPLAFLTPVLAAKLLTGPKAMTPKLAVGALIVLGVCLLFSTQLLLPTLDYPLVHVLLTGLLLFLLFYAKAGGTSPVLVVLMVISILAVPLVGTVDPELAGAVALGIYFAAAVSIAVVFISAAVFPDPPGLATPQSEERPLDADALSNWDRAALAARSLIVLYPLAITFQLFSLTSATVALMMTIFLSLEPTYGKHLKAGKGLILANLAGGIVGVTIYQLLIFVPSFTFFLLVVLFSGLWIGRWIFYESTLGKLLGAGITAVFLILGPSITGDEQAGATLGLRLLLILGAVVYVVLAFGLLERLTRGKRRLAI